MVNFWEFSSWGTFSVLAVLLISLLIANILKREVKFLRNSLIPTSVLGGLILLVVSTVYFAVSGEVMFDTEFFGGKGSSSLEIITYHSLALGFIASTLKNSEKKLDKKRAVEVFNTGVTTVASYLLQAVLGLGLTLLLGLILPELFKAAGVLLPFGYGQGTGQALNYGTLYEKNYGFVGGGHFGLTIAALGFLSASIGGVIHLHVLKKQGKFKHAEEKAESYLSHQVQGTDEVPMNGSIDKLSLQLSIVAFVYLITYGFMALIGSFVGDGLKLTIFGFNFLFGVLFATLFKSLNSFLMRKKIIKRQYLNNFLMTRISNTCFDMMIVAGIAVIRLDYIVEYWYILLLLGGIGAVSTYFYNRFIARKMFEGYSEEQFLVMFGMLTGTASTGMMLLREIDPDYQSPASENLIFQNFPAIVFGFPMMLLATLAPEKPLLTFILLVAFFVVMNVILFRNFIFKKKEN